MTLVTFLEKQISETEKEIRNCQLLLLIPTSPRSKAKLEKRMIELFEKQTRLKVQIELLSQKRLN